MKVLKILGAIVGVLFLAVLTLYLMGPKEVYMERSISINTSPEVIYNELNTFEYFNEWSPWYTKDTSASYQFTGPEVGVGSKLSWVSEDLGDGSMEITELKDNKMVLYQMDFGYGIAHARFKIEEVEGATQLTWTYEETPKVLSKAMYSVMNIEDVLATDYEQGLNNLKSYMESKSIPQDTVL